MHGNEGLRCRDCYSSFAWRDLEHSIAAMPDGQLVWSFVCPICRRVLRSEPFAFPPDYESETGLEDVG